MKKIIALILVLIMLLSFAACGGKGEDVTGKYLCVGEAYGDSPLGEPYEESWIELKKGGKGTYYSGYEFTLKWKLDGETFEGTVSFLGMEDAMTGTLKDGVIDVKYGDMKIRFVKEGAQAPADNGTGNTATSGATDAAGTTGLAGAGSFDFSAVRVAGNLTDAFAGAVGAGGGTDGDTGGDTGDGGFVSPTTSIELGRMWYGAMFVTDSVGSSTGDYTKDIIARLDESSDGRAYFEVYTDSSQDSEFTVLSIYITIDPKADGFIADIGNQDAWVLDRYLDADEAIYFSPTLENGALDMRYAYTDPNDGSTCNVRFFLREDSTPWDEANDPLPPSYAEYKAIIEG